MLSEAEDNLIDLGPGSPAVVSPRITSSPPPKSTATGAATGAAASPAHNLNTPSLSAALAGLGKKKKYPFQHSRNILLKKKGSC